MFVYITLFILVMIFSFLVENQEYAQVNTAPQQRSAAGRTMGVRTRQQVCNIWAAAAIFLLLTAVSACRIAVGNDYWVYRNNFELIMLDRHVSYEVGFNLVVWVIQSLFGYDNYIPVFAFFSIVTCFFFVKALYDQGEWFSGSLFLLMTGGFYYSSLNSVRYYFALAVALYAMKYVIRGEYGKFVLWIIAAAFFHKSILVVIPAYLAARWLASEKMKTWQVLVGLLLVISLVFGRDIYRWIIFKFYPFYEGSQFDHVEYSITNIGKCAGTLILAIICYKTAIKDNVRNKFYLYLSVAGFVIYTFGAFIPEVSRIGYYFVVSQVFLIPGMLKSMEAGIWKKVLTVGVAVAFLAHFALFLKTSYSVDIRLLPYLNWIFD